MSVEKYTPVGVDQASNTEMGKKIQESEIQVKSPDQVAPEDNATEPEFEAEQAVLDQKLDQIQAFVNMLDRPRDADDKNTVFARVESDAKSLLPEWKKALEELPDQLKQSTDGRDLDLKIKIVEKCLEDKAQIEQTQVQIQQM